MGSGVGEGGGVGGWGLGVWLGGLGDVNPPKNEGIDKGNGVVQY